MTTQTSPNMIMIKLNPTYQRYRVVSLGRDRTFNRKLLLVPKVILFSVYCVYYNVYNFQCFYLKYPLIYQSLPIRTCFYYEDHCLGLSNIALGVSYTFLGDILLSLPYFRHFGTDGYSFILASLILASLLITRKK